MKRILTLAPLFILSGCLLNQTDPAAVLPAKAFLKGQVGVQDMFIANQGEMAVISAQFAVQTGAPAPTTTPVATTLETDAGRLASVSQFYANVGNRAPACRKVKLERNPKPAPTPAPEPQATEKFVPVSVGRLGFGPALQESLTLLEFFKKEKQYQAKLQGGLPAGAYVIVGEGTEEVEAFNEVLSMPEDVHHLRMNGRDFGDPLTDFRPARDLELFWKDPSITNDQNAILMDMIVRDTDFVYAVRCGIKEDDIPSVSGFKTWNLDANWFSEMPRTGKADFYFIRAHMRATKSKRASNELQGMRTFYSHLDVQP